MNCIVLRIHWLHSRLCDGNEQELWFGTQVSGNQSVALQTRIGRPLDVAVDSPWLSRELLDRTIVLRFESQEVVQEIRAVSRRNVTCVGSIRN